MEQTSRGDRSTRPGGTRGDGDGLREVVVDTDTGIDDAMALLYLAGTPGVDIAAVTTVYGNCTVDDAVRNAAWVLDLAGDTRADGADVPRPPVSRGAAGPLAGEAHIASYVHGADGLGDLADPRPDPQVTDRSSAEQLVHLAGSAPGRYDLLALGPLTNLALALRIDPEVLTRFRSIVCMGGSGTFTAPGRSLMVDANVQNDPAAASAVLSAPRARLALVGVDVTGPTVLDEDQLAAITTSPSPWAAFAASALGFYTGFYAQEYGRRIMPVHDELAAAVLVHPELVTSSVTGPAAVVGTGYQERARVLVRADGEPVAEGAVRLHPATPLVASLPPTTAVTGVDRAAALADLVSVLASGRAR